MAIARGGMASLKLYVWLGKEGEKAKIKNLAEKKVTRSHPILLAIMAFSGSLVVLRNWKPIVHVYCFTGFFG